MSSCVESSRVGPFSMFDGEIMSAVCETTLFVGVFVMSGRLETILTFSGYFRIFEPRVYFSCSDIQILHPWFGLSLSADLVGALFRYYAWEVVCHLFTSEG